MAFIFVLTSIYFSFDLNEGRRATEESRGAGERRLCLNQTPPGD